MIDLFEDKADMAISNLYITNEMSKAADFTIQFMN
ncbi:hypothetical protein B4U79_07467, partial [Dinothrombium tinctorium]